MMLTLPRLRLPALLLLATSGSALLVSGDAHAKKLFLPRVHASSGTHGTDGAAAAPGKNEPVADAQAAEPAATPEAARSPEKPRDVAAGKGGQAGTAAAIAASRAEAEKVDRANDEGIDDNRDVVKPVLARHPDSNLVICIAGCGPEPQIVQVLPRAPEKTQSQVVPSSADDDGESEAVQQPSDGTIICVAGCKDGKRGEVVFRKGRLSWIDPNESDAVRLGLRRIAERLSGELRAIADAEQSKTLTTWSGMGQSALAAIRGHAAVADASADQPAR